MNEYIQELEEMMNRLEEIDDDIGESLDGEPIPIAIDSLKATVQDIIIRAE